MYCRGMPVLSPATSRERYSRAKAQNVPEARDTGREVRNEVEGDGARTYKKKHQIYRAAEETRRRTAKRLTGRSILHPAPPARTLWQNMCLLVHIRPTSHLSLTGQWDLGHALVCSQVRSCLCPPENLSLCPRQALLNVNTTQSILWYGNKHGYAHVTISDVDTGVTCDLLSGPIIVLLDNIAYGRKWGRKIPASHLFHSFKIARKKLLFGKSATPCSNYSITNQPCDSLTAQRFTVRRDRKEANSQFHQKLVLMWTIYVYGLNQGC